MYLQIKIWLFQLSMNNKKVVGYKEDLQKLKILAYLGK